MESFAISVEIWIFIKTCVWWMMKHRTMRKESGCPDNDEIVYSSKGFG
jgi:hypothetical protein